MIDAVVTVTTLGAMWVFAFWLYRDYRVDVFRQGLFALRDELFDYARRGGVSFDDPVYQALRDMCNGYIRFGHRLNLSSAVFFYWGLRPHEARWMTEHSFGDWWNDIVGRKPPEVRETLCDFKARLDRRVVEQVILGSPILVATVVPAAFIMVFIKFQAELARRVWSPVIGDIDEAALAAGQAV